MRPPDRPAGELLLNESASSLVPELFAFAWRLEGPAGAESLVTGAVAGLPAALRVMGADEGRVALFGRVLAGHRVRVERGDAIAFPRFPPPDSDPEPRRLPAPKRADLPCEWALLDLDGNDRAALLLKEVWGLNHEEVGQVLGEPASQVRARVRGARAVFARRLEELEGASIPGEEDPPARCGTVRRALEGRGLGTEGPLDSGHAEHLATCPSCAAWLGALTRAGLALRSVPRERPVPAALRSSCEAALSQGGANEGHGPGTPLPPGHVTDALETASETRTVRAVARGRRLLWASLPVVATAALVLWVWLTGPSARPELVLARELAAAQCPLAGGAEPPDPMALPPGEGPPPFPMLGGVEPTSVHPLRLAGRARWAAQYDSTAGCVTVVRLDEADADELTIRLAAADHSTCLAVGNRTVCGRSIGGPRFLAASDADRDYLSVLLATAAKDRPRGPTSMATPAPAP